ncbi:hypothetical protein C8R43DRAFT_1143777 [Mycena crocata]|nr:hypothetical protein C8R43DRAFT_1143777 [Mycena crocata]
MFDMPFFPPPFPLSAEVNLGPALPCWGHRCWVVLPPPPPPSMLALVAVVVAVDVEPIQPSESLLFPTSRQQLTVGIAAHDLSSTSMLSSLSSTSLTQPPSSLGRRYILGLAKDVWLQGSWSWGYRL